MTDELDTTGKITIDGSGSTTDEGDLNLTTFDGQAVSSGDAVVALTYYGDANLDRQVNSTDYDMIGSIDSNSSGGSGAGWTDGDFNYDGSVDGFDVQLFNYSAFMVVNVLAAAPAGPVATQVKADQSAAPTTGGTTNVEMTGVPGTATSATITDVQWRTGFVGSKNRHEKIGGPVPLPIVTPGATLKPALDPANSSAQNISITVPAGTPAGIYTITLQFNGGSGGGAVVTVTVN